MRQILHTLIPYLQSLQFFFFSVLSHIGFIRALDITPKNIIDNNATIVIRTFTIISKPLLYHVQLPSF